MKKNIASVKKTKKTTKNFAKIIQKQISGVQVLSGLIAVFSGMVCLSITGCASQKPYVAKVAEDGVTPVNITVHHGFKPSQIIVPASHPVRVRFTRTEHAQKSCMDAVMIPDEDITVNLPPRKPKTVLIKSHPKGETIQFACGMDMVKGSITFR